MSHPHRMAFEVAPGAEARGRARDAARRGLAGVLPPDDLEGTLLIVSEMVTLGMSGDTPTPMTVTIAVEGRRVRVELRDGPDLRVAGPAFQVVKAFSDKTGSDAGDGWVWAETTYP